MKTYMANVVISEENLDRLNEKIYLRHTRTSKKFNQTKVLDRPLRDPNQGDVTTTFWPSLNPSESSINSYEMQPCDVLGAKPTTKPTNNLIKTSAGTNEDLLASIELMLNAAPG